MQCSGSRYVSVGLLFKALPHSLSLYRPTEEEARRQACWRKGNLCHTWQDTSVQAWHPQSRVTACGVTVGPTRAGRPGGSQVRAGWPDPTGHPWVTTPRQTGRQRPCSSVNSTNVKSSSKKPLPPNRIQASRLSDTLFFQNNFRHLGKNKTANVLRRYADDPTEQM